MSQQVIPAYVAWTRTSGDSIPHNAVVGGRDNTSMEDLYIGRARHNNNVIPGKVPRSHKCVYVAYGGKEVPYQAYDILVSDSQQLLKWVPESGGRVPPNSVQAGSTDTGEPLYIARAQAPDGGMCVGKLHGSHGCCYIPWGGEERAQKSYEVLTQCEL